MFNYSSGTTKYGIRDSLSFLQGRYINSWSNANIFKIIEAKTDVSGLEIDIDYGGSTVQVLYGGEAGVKLMMRVGPRPYDLNSWNSGVTRQIDFNYTTGAVKPFVNKLIKVSDVFDIPIIRTGEIVHIWFQFSTNDSIRMNYKNIKFSAKAYEETFDVVTRSVNLYDATKKVIKDI